MTHRTLEHFDYKNFNRNQALTRQNFFNKQKKRLWDGSCRYLRRKKKRAMPPACFVHALLPVLIFSDILITLMEKSVEGNEE